MQQDMEEENEKHIETVPGNEKSMRYLRHSIDQCQAHGEGCVSGL